ncbi:MAG: hemerythrin domain-containing protein [Acidobacteria bacterium]|nr:hemerythrin domain-containing protein [Acidobacteriota bacterium]
MSHVIRDLPAALPVPDSGIASSPLLDLPGGTKVVLFAMDQGQEISPHAAPFPAQILLLEGRLEVLIGDAWNGVAPHEGLELPAGLPHGVKALAPSHFLLTMLRGAGQPADRPAAGAAVKPPRSVASPVLQHWMDQHDEALRRLDRMEGGIGKEDWTTVGEVARWLYDELKAHNEAEERCLFPLMDPFFGGQHGPTDCMRDEHRLLWDSTLQLQQELEARPGGSPRAGTLALSIVGNLRAHIDKENQVLYPMAERILTPDQLRQLEQAYAAG